MFAFYETSSSPFIEADFDRISPASIVSFPFSTMQRNSFFVRVKRSRDDDPVENLCIVEDATPAKKRSIRDLDQQLASLSNIDHDRATQVSQPKRLLLSRVKTLKCADDSLIHTAPTQNEIDEMPMKRKREPTKVVVTSGKKTVSSETSDSFVIIDMAQMVTKTRTPLTNSALVAPAASVPKAPVSRILDPATRMLDRGIIQAMKNGDFNDISSALMQGANADHQTAVACTTLGSATSSGCTALMAATLHCNIRMVKRLLTKGVDVTKQNSDGATALDLLKLTARNMKDGLEIQALIQNALLKVSQAPSMRAATVRENIRQGHDGYHTSSTGALSDAMDTEDNYVYDIYCINPAGSASEDTQHNSDPSTNHTSIADSTAAAAAPSAAEEAYSVVRVEGLRILENGEVDLMMAYDSDWSDLGDDEDPDSNDERFHGNDYPEDEENEGEELVDSDEEYEHFREQAAKTLPPKLRGVEAIPNGNDRHSARANTGNRAPRVPVRPSAGNDSDSEDETPGRRRVHFSAPKGGVPKSSANGLFAAPTANMSQQRTNKKQLARDAAFDDLLAQESFAAEEAEQEHSESDLPATNGYDSDECDVYGNPLKSAFRDEEQNSDYDFDADMDEGKPNPANANAASLKLSSAHDLLYDDDDNLPAFERRYGVGKVLRPQLLGGGGGSGEGGIGEFAQQGLYEAPHTTESLQELWGEVEGNREDYNHEQEGNHHRNKMNRQSAPGGPEGDAHGDRLQHMRQRTGMVFAAAPREFDPSTGLAKYGAELSDDDDDLMHTDGQIEFVGSHATGEGIMGAFGTPGMAAKLHAFRPAHRPPLDTVAYDSELDGSD